jgi:hypothetical protein
MPTIELIKLEMRVEDVRTNEPLGEVQVEAWGKGLAQTAPFGSAVTDQNGNFTLLLDQATVFRAFGERDLPKILEFKLSRSGFIITIWQGGFLQLPSPVPTPVPRPKPIIRVEMTEIIVPPQPTDRFVVLGTVRRADGKPLDGTFTVTASDRDVRSEQPLGSSYTATVTPETGPFTYEIPYSADRFARAEKKSADLIVRVFNQERKLEAESPIIFNAPVVATIDLSIHGEDYREPSEYARYLAELDDPLQDVVPKNIPQPTSIDKLADLRENETYDLKEEKYQDFTFLAGETGINPDHIALLALAARFTKEEKLPPETFPQVFYGLFRQNLPTNLPALLAQSPQVLRRALEASVRDNIIPPGVSAKIDSILKQLQDLIVEQAFKEPKVSGRSSLGALLSTAIASPDLQKQFLTKYVNHQGPTEEFWKTLPSITGMSEAQVRNLQFTLQLGVLTLNHVPLIQELRRRHPVTSTRDLVQLDAAAWTALINTRRANGEVVGIPPDIPGVTSQERVTNYVNGIVGLLRVAYPTDAVAQIVAKAPGINLESPLRQALSRFFANSPDFDISSTHVDKYIAKNAVTVFNGIADGDKTKVVDQAKRLQRVFQVSTSPETMTALLGTGLDSAYAIANIPRAAFVERYKTKLGSEQEALNVYRRAQHVYATNLHVLTQAHQALYDVHTMVTGTSPDAYTETIKKVPALAELFGSVDLCDCAHCRSVYSPAAYFVDLLEFLKRKGPKPLEVLVKRRPELEHIRLTCENTNTAMPYVDLVNEVLESYVALGMKLNVTTAHDTGDATADELKANPQFTNVLAYDGLKGAVYPFTLPYDHDVNLARIYLEHLGSSRHEVMRLFNKDETVPRQREIDAEYLKITQEEYRVFTGKQFDGSDAATASDPVRRFYGYDDPSLTATPSSLANVPEFLRRTGIGYTELVELFKTKFINPGREAVEYLNDLKIGLQAFVTLYENGFPDPPSPEVSTALQNARIEWNDFKQWSKATFKDIDDVKALNNVLLLYERDSKCDLTTTKIHRLDKATPRDEQFMKLHRLIRLWRKLGWTIQDLDKAMTALGAIDITPDLLQGLASIVWLERDLGLKSAIILSLWSTIDTYGEGSLYKKLFQSKAVQQLDKGFAPRPQGVPISETSVLTDKNEPLSGHIPALLAAMRISADDLKTIRAAAKLDAPDAKLTLKNVSTLYSYVVLAKGLKLRLNELVSLKALVGSAIDPFAKPKDAVEFVKIVRKVQRSNFKIDQLNYLFRHLAEPSSKLAPERGSLLLLAKTLRDGLTSIVAEHAAADDPTGELTRKELGFVFTSEIVDEVVRMIDGSAVYTVPLTNLPADLAKLDNSKKVSGIDPEKMPDAVKNKIAYDKTAKVLRFNGPMTPAEHDALIASSAITLPADEGYLDAIEQLYRQPRTLIHDALNGFLDPADAETQLLETASLNKDGKPVTTLIAGKFAYFLDKVLPYLRDTLSHALVKQTIADALKLDGAMAELLLEKLATKQTMADCLALSIPGLSATYFTTPEPESRTDANVAFDGKGTTAKTKIPTNARSAGWTGLLLAPNNGDFTFYVVTNGRVRLWIGDNSEPILDDKSTDDQSTKELKSAPITLKAGQLCDLRLEVRELPQAAPAIVELRWSSASVPKDIIPSMNLYPGKEFGTFAKAFRLLHKLSLLINGFKLTVKEVDYLSEHPKDFAGFDLQALPRDRPDPPDQTDQKAVSLFEQWRRLNEFTFLRNSLSQGEVSLVEVLGEAVLAAKLISSLSESTDDNDKKRKQDAVDKVKDKLLSATGWDEKLLDALIGLPAFNLNASPPDPPVDFNLTVADLKNEIWLVRLHDCLKLIRRLGASPEQLFTWASKAPSGPQAQDIKNTVKAKYDDETWLTVAKPLNDLLREEQKAALIAFLLPRTGLENSNRLFEYFLIDVDMSPCMMTSRIKQAISSVQLFVQRCLMNLETGVSPDDIDSDQWKWRKNYRVWEANRKVFLYPENWIEEGLRDNKSPFFKELESELLQSDLTMDTAETAFLNYLEKLDQVARLEIVGMHREEEINTLHVFGRTFHTPHMYYYRRLEKSDPGGVWTPWEKVQVDIEGDHLMPVIWNRRLYIFWPMFTEKAVPRSSPSNNNEPPRRYWEIKLAWSEYKHNKWSGKQISSEFVISKEHGTDKDATAIPKDQHAFKAYVAGDGSLIVQVFCQFRPYSDGVFHLADFRLSGCQGTINIWYQQWYFNDRQLQNFLDNKHQKDVEGRFFGDNFLLPPNNTLIENMTFKELPSSDDLTLAEETTLENTPNRYGLLTQNFPQFALPAEFFYQDDWRSYYVISKKETELSIISDGSVIGYDLIMMLSER